MNPQQRSLSPPLGDDGALKEPQARSRLVSVARYVVVFRRIWGGDPLSGVLLQLVTYDTDSGSVMKRQKKAVRDIRFILFISPAIPCIVTGTSGQPTRHR